jgi:uncharacterized protein YfaQ (DUF2300 family)
VLARTILLGLLLLSLPALADTLQLARLTQGKATLTELSTGSDPTTKPLPSDLTTPLGSLWKLYMHAWLLDTQAPERPYACLGQDPDEVYCCDPGESIARSQALVKSCGLYYAPARLGIDPAAWRGYWTQRNAPAWLIDLTQLQPATEVAVADLLSTLATLPAQAELRRLLLDVVVQARDPQVLAELGGRLRVKTWSWHRPSASAERIGGFAGWQVDGTPVFASAAGSSQAVLARFAAPLAQALDPATSIDSGECVDVALFARYPIATVTSNGGAARPGALRGEYRVRFANGNELRVDSHGELLLSREQGIPRLTARLTREDYVARVLDREAAAEPVAAAQALSIAIRSYLKQTARHAGTCLAIDDSSAEQRVAPRGPSAASRAIVAATADLVLSGSAVGYHRDQAGTDRLSWQSAVTQAQAGAGYAQILGQAFPRAELTRWDQPDHACEPLPAASDWLHARVMQWRERLQPEAGYQESADFSVCRLGQGRPHVDRAHARIYARGLTSLQDRLDLTHEYLHLAFEAHPRSSDEAFVESLARRLLLE